MSDHTEQSEPASPPPAAPAAGNKRPPSKPSAVKPRRGVLASIALLVALLALAGVAFGGWQWWQWRQDRDAGAQASAQLHKRLAALESSVAATQHGQAGRQQAQQALQASSQVLGQRLDGMSERMDSLEDAVASLARHNQQGRRGMLLDQTELLLRMGQERYALFHDAAGALKAYVLAARSLAAVDDPAFAGVRRALDAERKTLAATQPTARADDLAALTRLRGVITQLPLKRPNVDPGKAVQGFWPRVWHALSTAVVVRRVDASPQSLADVRLTRQLAALNVAQAEAARLAWDHKAYRAALRRVDQALATAFDTQDAGVRKARDVVTRLLKQSATPAQPPELGKTLQQLRNVRAVRGVSDDTPVTPSSTAPAAPVTPGTST